MKDIPACSRRRRQLWTTLLKKVWNVDALKCPKCRGKMKVISFIEDPRPPPQPLELVCEPLADYVPWKDDVPEIEVG